MSSGIKTSLAVALAAAAFAAGAEPLETIDNGEVRGVLAPERLTDGRINHQVDPADPFILSPLSEMPDDLTPALRKFVTKDLKRGHTTFRFMT